MHLKHVVSSQELKRVFPFLSWTNRITRQTLASDSIAGIVVALILIPQSMAYAQLAGLPPQQGLYAAFIAPIIGALFGSSSKLATGPVAIVSLVTASAFAGLKITDPMVMVQYAILLAALVGIIQLLFGVLKLGVIANLISHPVMLGFSNAAALIIASSQFPKIFGLKIANYDHHYQTMYHFLLELPQTHLSSLIFAVVSVLAIVVIRKINPMLPGVLFVLVFSIFISYATNFGMNGGSIVGNVPQGLPQFRIIDFDFSNISTLFSTAIVISILGFMESFSIAKSLALRSGEKIDANQEFIGQGLANIASASVQGYPIAGSFSRSAVNFRAGAQTGTASIITGICVIVTLLFLTPLLYHLPQSVLSAIIVASVINLISLDKLKATFRIIRSDGIIAIITFIATLFYAPHLDTGILIGVALSASYYIYTRTKPHFVQFTANKAGKIVEVHKDTAKLCKYITIIRFDGSLFFANAAYLENRITNALASKNRHTKYLLFDAQGINFIDSSGLETLENLQKELHEVGIEVLFIRMKDEILELTRKTHFYHKIRHNHYESRTNAIRAIYEHAHAESDEKSCPLISLVNDHNKLYLANSSLE